MDFLIKFNKNSKKEQVRETNLCFAARKALSACGQKNEKPLPQTEIAFTAGRELRQDMFLRKRRNQHTHPG